MIFSEFQGHPANESLLPAIPFHKTKQNKKEEEEKKEEITSNNIRLVGRVGGHGHVISGQKFLG